MSEPRTVRVERVIAAPRATVWSVLVDYPRYGEWNPFTVGVTTPGAVGDPVRLDVQLGGKRLVMNERMRVFEPGVCVGWGLRVGAGLLLDCTRVQAIEAVDDATTRYVCHEAFKGLLVPLFYNRLHAELVAGFQANADALAARAEAIALAGG